MWKQSFRDVPDAFLLRGCIIVNTSYLGCWGPLFEWWQLGDVNPVRWNSYTDLHLNLAKKRFKSTFLRARFVDFAVNFQVKYIQTERDFYICWLMFGLARPKRIHPYSPSTTSGSSRFSLDHTFHSIENLTDGLHPLQHLFLIRHIPYTQRRATDPLNWDDTYLKKRYSQFYMAAMDARYSGNYMRPSLDFLQSFGLNRTHLGSNW